MDRAGSEMTGNARVAGRTAASKAAFLAALRDRFTVRHAAHEARVSRSAAYLWRDQDPDFARAWEDAREDAVKQLEKTMYDKAIAGDTIAGIFLLKGAHPERYRDNVKVDVTGTVLHGHIDLASMTEAERRELLLLAAGRGDPHGSAKTPSTIEAESSERA